jgi:hypothetical protein
MLEFRESRAAGGRTCMTTAKKKKSRLDDDCIAKMQNISTIIEKRKRKLAQTPRN